MMNILTYAASRRLDFEFEYWLSTVERLMMKKSIIQRKKIINPILGNDIRRIM